MAKEDAEGLSFALTCLPLRLFCPMTERWKIGPIMEPKGVVQRIELSLFCLHVCFFVLPIHRVLVFLPSFPFWFSRFCLLSRNLMRSDLVDGFERMSRWRDRRMQVENFGKL